MKTIQLGFILILCVVAFFGCCRDTDPEPSGFSLTMVAEYDSEPLVFLEPIKYGDDNIVLSTSNFYMDQPRLVKSDGTEIILSTIEYVDFSDVNVDIENANKGITFDFSNVEKGDYTHIRFGVGVNPVDNGNDWTDYSSDHVLSKSGHYWSAWNSFIFVKMEGRYDIDKDNSFSLPFLFHSGQDQNYAAVELPIELNIGEGTTGLRLGLEHKTLFEINNGLFDIPSNPTNHEPDLPGIIMIKDNMNAAWSVK